MLNEIRELEQYTADPDSKRLKIRYIGQKNLTGIARAMTIIARWCIFDEFKELETAQKISNTKYILSLWLGNLPEEKVKDSYLSEKYGYLENWMGKYLESLFEKKDNPKLREALDSLKIKRDKSIYREYNTGKKNDRNAVLYEHIIAQAMQLGKLKNRYLVCRNFTGNKSELAAHLTKYASLKPLDLKKITDRRSFDNILKITAYYLLAEGKRSDGYKRIVVTDFINWLVTDVRMEKMYSKDMCLYKYKQQNLFDKKSAKEKDTNSDQLVRINSQWLEDMGWCLMTEEELEAARATNSSLKYFYDEGNKLMTLN